VIHEAAFRPPRFRERWRFRASRVHSQTAAEAPDVAAMGAGMTTDELKAFVRTDFLSRSERDLLQSEPTVLLGVSAEAATQLRALEISTVFDLALSRVFAAASHLTTAANGVSEFLRFGAAPTDAVRPDALAGKRIDQLQFEPVSVLAGVRTEHAAALQAALLVKTVRDLALWPPYRAAQTILTRVLNPDHASGFDPEAPGELVPMAGHYPTERVVYNANFLIGVDPADTVLVEIDKNGPVRLSGQPALITKPATGAQLTFSQNWYPIGLSLGQLLYCLPLAPGESTKLAVIDWRRRVATSLDEDVSQTEALSNTLTQNRAISEVVNSVASEVQSGSSTIKSDASSGSIGAAGAGLLPGPALAGGTASASVNSSTTTGVFTSAGKREIAASMQQHISDSTHQQAFSSRNRHASTVSEAVAEERESISTRTVTNYNHMHALTVQYYEVVQVYRTELRTERARRLLFVPFQPLDFDDEQLVLRYRSALLAGAQDPYVRDLVLQATGVVGVSLPLARFLPFVADPDDSKKDQLKAAKRHAKERAKAAARLKLAFNIARRDGGVVRVHDTNLTSWDMPGDVELIDLGWDNETDRVRQMRVVFESGNEIEVSDNGYGRTSNVVNEDLGSAVPVRQLASIELDLNGADEAQLQRLSLRFRAGSRRFSLPCDSVLPANRESARLASFSAPVPISELAALLNEQRLHYSQIVWLNTDPNELVMHMGNLTYKGKRVVEYIESRPVATLGNALGFIWNDEDDPAWTEWKDKNASTAPKHDLVPLPTDGVFAEAVLGRFNAAEKLDMSRFWNWQDSPIPIHAPDIAAIQAGQHEGVTAAPAGNLEGSVLNIVAPRDLPAPTGLGPALNAIASANMFRDMSGAAQLAAINQAALQAAAAGATSAGAQAGANMATFAEFTVEAIKAAAPLIAAAMGVPLPPAPGGTNISNAGAVANEAGKVDAVVSAGGGSSSNVATGGAASATGGAGGSGGAGGIGTGGGGGSATSTATGVGVARSTSGAGRGSNREDVVRRTAGLPPREPEAPPVRDAVFNFIFLDHRGIPVDGRFDLTLHKDGIVVDGQTVTRENPFFRGNAEFVDGLHRVEVTLGNVPGPLIITVRGEPVAADSVGKVFVRTKALPLPSTFTTYTFNIAMGFETIEVTASGEAEARLALTGGTEVTVAGEEDTVSSSGRRKPRLSKRPKLPLNALAVLSSLIDLAFKATVGGELGGGVTVGGELKFEARVPDGSLDIVLDPATSG
jgi:hypothetical protein